jgi:hypothetical protein
MRAADKEGDVWHSGALEEDGAMVRGDGETIVA